MALAVLAAVEQIMAFQSWDVHFQCIITWCMMTYFSHFVMGIYNLKLTPAPYPLGWPGLCVGETDCDYIYHIMFDL